MKNFKNKFGFIVISIFLYTVPTLGFSMPLKGDLLNGEKLFFKLYINCYGGTELKKSRIFDALETKRGLRKFAETLNTLNDQTLLKRIQQGDEIAGLSACDRSINSGISLLDAWDVLAYIRTLYHKVWEAYPKAAKYIYKQYEIDKYGRERLRKGLKRDLREDEKKIGVFTLFVDRKIKGEPRYLEQTPQNLSGLTKASKIGYTVFMTLPSGVPVVFYINKNIKVISAKIGKLYPSKKAKSLQKILNRMKGKGKRGRYRLLIPRAPRRHRKFAREVAEAFMVASEAIYMYEIEERNRTWADDEF